MIKIVSSALASVVALAARVTAPTTGGALKSLTKTLEQLDAVAVHHKAQIEKHEAAVEKAKDAKAVAFSKVDAEWSAALDKASAMEAKAEALRNAAQAKAKALVDAAHAKADAADDAAIGKFDAARTKANEAKAVAQAEADRASKVSERLAALLA